MERKSKEAPEEQLKVLQDQKKAVSVVRCAEILDIGKNLAYEAVARGEIPSIRVGGRILVPLAALDKMLEGSWSAGC